VEQEIAANIARKMISFYWGWLLFGFAMLLLGAWGAWMGLRWLIGRARS
jgi:hypothetical protein